jgi:anaphase-promoting complex subunit 4
MSRLRGLSKFQDSNLALGLKTQELDQIFDTLHCLHLLSHTILIYSSLELRQFTSFSSWLRTEIEIQATDPLSVTAEENLNKDAMPDYPLILEYVQGAMLNSKLYDLLNLQINDNRPTWDLMGKDNLSYEQYKQDIRRVREEQNTERKLPGLDSLLTCLNRQCATVFQGIAEAQGRKVRLGDSVQIGTNVTHSDIRMITQVSSIDFV